jgi:hypothetical protein
VVDEDARVRWRGWGYEDISRRLVCAALCPVSATVEN